MQLSIEPPLVLGSFRVAANWELAGLRKADAFLKANGIEQIPLTVQHDINRLSYSRPLLPGIAHLRS